MELMRSQKNELLEIIKNYELDPFNFKWTSEKVEGRKSSVLRYKDTDYFFCTCINPNGFIFLYSPGVDKYVERSDVYSWSNGTSYFIRWLLHLKREIDQPDLWEELEKIKLFENVEFETENNIQQFTYQETLQIQEGINNIREYLLEEVKGNTQEIKAINDKLDYLIDSSKRMGRIDWKNVFVGAIVNIITSVGLNPEQGQIVVTLFQSAVSGIMRLINTAGV